MAGLFYLTVEANRQTPAVLGGQVWVLTAAFLLAIAAWIAWLVIFFTRKRL